MHHLHTWKRQKASAVLLDPLQRTRKQDPEQEEAPCELFPKISSFTSWPRWGFLCLSTVNILGHWRWSEAFLVLTCSVHCRMFSSICGFYPLDASSLPTPRCKSQNVYRYWQISPRGQARPLLENHWPRQATIIIHGVAKLKCSFRTCAISPERVEVAGAGQCPAVVFFVISVKAATLFHWTHEDICVCVKRIWLVIMFICVQLFKAD